MLNLREMPSAAPTSVTSSPGHAPAEAPAGAGIFDRVPMKQDFLALGTVKGAHNDALAQQTVDRAF